MQQQRGTDRGKDGTGDTFGNLQALAEVFEILLRWDREAGGGA